MERYHDPSQDPQSLTSVERERQRIAAATEAFLAGGGKIEVVGHQMQAAGRAFVIDPKKTPVYAHLFVPGPEPVTNGAQPAGLAPQQLAARLMVQAALGSSPQEAARAIGISERQARQIARDFRIQFKRQR